MTLRAHASPLHNQSVARVKRSEGRAGCSREAERADRVAAKAQNHYHARPRGEQTCFSFALSSVEISCRSVLSSFLFFSFSLPVVRAPLKYTRVIYRAKEDSSLAVSSSLVVELSSPISVAAIYGTPHVTREILS